MGLKPLKVYTIHRGLNKFLLRKQSGGGAGLLPHTARERPHKAGLLPRNAHLIP